ncbi:DUF4352 domain-containing protein [Enterococcus mundtii]|uniref:DUF4352 domain-containing protein n=1 Tax=Enterococcus mundtii TaxID=53346 RepID=UPI0032DF372E
MKKFLIYTVMLLSGTVLLSACHTSNDQTKHKNNETTIESSGKKVNVVSELGKTKTTDEFEITVKQAEIVDNPLNTDLGHSTLKVDVSAKNITNKEQSIGTGDFKIKDAKGDEYTFTSSDNNFGDVVQPGKTIDGSGYYSIPNDMKAGVIIYNPYESSSQQKWEAVFSKDDSSSASVSNEKTATSGLK